MAYTTIDDPSAYFQTTLYSSDGGGGSITVTNDGNSDLQPDWLWIKVRNDTNNHNTFDTSRGIANRLKPNTTDAEDGSSGVSVSSDGFATGTSLGDINNTSGANNYVAWQWKANGGTTTTNDASATSVGDTDSVYQVNSTAKFSIVGWTGSGSGSVNIAHGLGSTPKFILMTQRDGANSRLVYHHRNTAADDPHDSFLKLNNNSASGADDNNYFMNNTAPTSTVVTFGNGNEANQSGTYIGYFFDEVQGYSKFGSYTGNGNADGPFVYTGFKPAFVIIKNTADSADWTMWDTTRYPTNPQNIQLYPNLSNAEDSPSASTIIDLLSNGFKLRGTNNKINGSSDKIIYMAFAEHPFVSSEGVPTTAR